MATVKLKDRQTPVDIAIQEYGSFEGVFALAERNGISITEVLAAGQELETAPQDVVDKLVSERFRVQGVKPATELENPLQEGIGFWAIEYDFVIN